jgi:hypothetical protein
MAIDPTIEKLQRVIYREFLLEPGLHAEAGLEQLPARLGALMRCPADEALSRLTSTPLLEGVTVEQLREVMTIRDMAIVSRTAAALAAELKEPIVGYVDCCRSALCYAVIGSHGHVFSALRAAASKHDDWARHHYLYGLILGLGGSGERARWELGMALQLEPYEEGRVRIRWALDILDDRM